MPKGTLPPVGSEPSKRESLLDDGRLKRPPLDEPFLRDLDRHGDHRSNSPSRGYGTAMPHGDNPGHGGSGNEEVTGSQQAPQTPGQ